MPKIKCSPLARLRIAVKLEIVLAAKKQSIPKKDLQKFFTSEYGALRKNRRTYIRKLLLEDWPKYGNNTSLKDILGELVPYLTKRPDEAVTVLGLCYPYFHAFAEDDNGLLDILIVFARRQYEREVSIKYPKLDLYEEDEDEDDAEMWYFIERQLEKPD